MLVYTNEPYQVHALGQDDYKLQYQVVNKVTGFVEEKTPSLTNALFLCEANAKALDKFLKEAKGQFNPELQEQPKTANAPEEAEPVFEEIVE